MLPAEEILQKNKNLCAEACSFLVTAAARGRGVFSGGYETIPSGAAEDHVDPADPKAFPRGAAATPPFLFLENKGLAGRPSWPGSRPPRNVRRHGVTASWGCDTSSCNPARLT